MEMLQGSLMQQLHDVKDPGPFHPTCCVAHSFGFNPWKVVSWSQDHYSGNQGGVSVCPHTAEKKEERENLLPPRPYKPSSRCDWPIMS